VTDRRKAVFVFAVTVLVFSRSLYGDFLDWDDRSNLVDNIFYRGFNLPWIFGLHFVHWYPLTWLSFSLDHALWGLDPFGFHLTNVLLHGANAALFYMAAGSVPAALFFSLHPLRVESVAWITERSDLLSAFFLLASLRFKSAWLYALAALSKATVVPFPLAWKPARKPVYLALAAAAGALAVLAQRQAGALWSVEQLGPFERLGVYIHNAAFYLAKTVLPFGLMPLYPMPGSFPFPWAAAALLALITFLVWRRKEWREGWCWYLLFLIPVAGLIKTGPQLAADRYSYLACLPLALLVRGKWSWPILALLAVLTWRQQGVWKDSETFWRSMAGNSSFCHGPARNNLGNLLSRQGRREEAERAYESALVCSPGHPVAVENLSRLRGR
jgi:tetratricopeptide (TPR) repeat protein